LVAEYLEEGCDPDNAGFYFEWLVAKGLAYAAPIRGAWFDIGTPDALAEARHHFSQDS